MYAGSDATVPARAISAGLTASAASEARATRASKWRATMRYAASRAATDSAALRTICASKPPPATSPHTARSSG